MEIEYDSGHHVEKIIQNNKLQYMINMMMNLGL